MEKISIVVPVFNAIDTLDELIKDLKTNILMISTNFEIILVDDFSGDNSWEKIKDLAKNDKNIVGIKLSKNYGLDIAVTAGIEKSNGDFVCISFCDLQDPLDKLPEMYKMLKDNKSIDIVSSYFTNRHSESFFNKLFSKVYWKIFSFFIKSHYPEEEGLFRIITRKAANFYLQHNKTFKHIKILNDTGLKKIHFKMEENLRIKGKSGFTLKKKLEFAVDYLTSYSYRPLLYTSFLGFIVSFLSSILTIAAVFFKIFGIIQVPGWTSLFAIISFFFSLLFFNLAVIAVYLSKNIEESKNSPLYFIDEHINYK
jgi:glycosyltransferase involved in cell wall biosynthesis